MYCTSHPPSLLISVIEMKILDLSVLQYGLSNFQGRDTTLHVWQKPIHSKKKSLYFVKIVPSHQKLDSILENKLYQNLVFLNLKNNQKGSDVFFL